MKPIFLVLFIILSVSSFSRNKMDYFMGAWNFEIWFTGNEKPVPDLTATWKLEKGLNWIEGYFGTVSIDGAQYTHEIIFFNFIKQRYERIVTTTDGILVKMETHGWNQGILVWEGTRLTGEILTPLKEEIFQTDANKFEAFFYEKIKGEWTNTQKELLSRIK